MIFELHCNLIDLQLQVTMRLLWQLENNEQLKEALKNGTAMFGTLDTWLLYRLTKGSVYQTDISCASATGLYDPFLSKWASFAKMLNIPITLLPPVCDSGGSHLGYVSPEVWGSPIRITCSVNLSSVLLFLHVLDFFIDCSCCRWLISLLLFTARVVFFLVISNWLLEPVHF